jgi:hypothetical protein
MLRGIRAMRSTIMPIINPSFLISPSLNQSTAIFGELDICYTVYIMAKRRICQQPWRDCSPFYCHCEPFLSVIASRSVAIPVGHQFASAPCFINLHLPTIGARSVRPMALNLPAAQTKVTVTANVHPPGTSSGFPKRHTEITPITVTVPTNSDTYRISYRSHPIHLSHLVIVGNTQGVIIKTDITVAIEVTAIVPVTATGD